MKVFYSPKQSARSNASSSPSAQKPSQVVAAWKKSDVPVEICSFKPLAATQIALAHDAKYVRGVLAGRTANGFGNKSRIVAKTLPWVAGSVAAAALHAFRTGKPTFSPTSGAHHAHFDHGGGFCTFEMNVIAALLAHKAGAKRVGILDLDQHGGDGTASIIKKLGLTWIQHWSYGFQDIRPANSESWLRDFPRTVFAFEGCDLVICNMGVDCAISDPLGGALTDDQLRHRDHIVYSTFARLGIGTVSCLAGGYEKDELGTIAPVIRRHVTTFEECYRANR